MGISSFSSRLSAPDMVRGVARLLRAMDYMCLPEFSLRNSRRTDITALGPKGEVIHVEIKVSVADFNGDTKWPEYLAHCDQFYFAMPDDFPLALAARDTAQPQRTGLIVSDGFDAHILRGAAVHPLNAARRKALILSFARCAAARSMRSPEPDQLFF
jgi:hypothetical protein